MARPEDGYSDRPNERDDRYDDSPRRDRRRARGDDEFDYGLRGRFRREDVPNHLGLAILVTLLCCQIGGIVAVIYAAQANSKAEKGDFEGAIQSAKTAKTWIIVSFIVGLILQPLLIWLQLAAEFDKF